MCTEYASGGVGSKEFMQLVSPTYRRDILPPHQGRVGERRNDIPPCDGARRAPPQGGEQLSWYTISAARPFGMHGDLHGLRAAGFTSVPQRRPPPYQGGLGGILYEIPPWGGAQKVPPQGGEQLSWYTTSAARLFGAH